MKSGTPRPGEEQPESAQDQAQRRENDASEQREIADAVDDQRQTRELRTRRKE